MDRTVARALSSAVKALSGSSARVVTSRETVGSEATGPKTPGSARSAAMSARQSPPRASAIARSQTIFPGSWTAFGCRRRASAVDRAWPRPVAVTVVVSSTAPACQTTPAPVVSSVNDGYNPVGLLTRKVLLNWFGHDPRQVASFQLRAPFSVIDTYHAESA